MWRLTCQAGLEDPMGRKDTTVPQPLVPPCVRGMRLERGLSSQSSLDSQGSNCLLLITRTNSRPGRNRTIGCSWLGGLEDKQGTTLPVPASIVAPSLALQVLLAKTCRQGLTGVPRWPTTRGELALVRAKDVGQVSVSGEER